MESSLNTSVLRAPQAPFLVVPQALSDAAKKRYTRRPATAAESDTLVRVRVGDHTTFLSVASLRRTASILPTLLAETTAHTQPDAQGIKTLIIEGDGPSFRHVECFLRSGSLPRGLQTLDLDYIGRAAKNLAMPELLTEVQQFYPLREAARRSMDRFDSDPCHATTDALMLGARLVLHGFDDEALIHLQRAARAHPPLPIHDIATAAYQDPDLRRSSLLFAYPYLRTLSAKAQVTFTRCLAQTPARHHFLFGPAGHYLSRNREGFAASQFLRKIASFTAEDSPCAVAQNIAVSHLATGQYNVAEHKARGAYGRYPTASIVAATLGIALQKLARHDEATVLLHKATSAASHFELPAQAYLSFGLSLAHVGQADEAWHQFSWAFSQAPYDEDICEAMAAHAPGHMPQGHITALLQHYVAMAPRNERAHVHLADHCARQGQLDAAKKHYDEALVLSPLNLDALNKRVDLAVAMQDLRTAVSKQHKLVSADPQNQRTWVKLDALNAQLQQQKRAVPPSIAIPHRSQPAGAQSTLMGPYVPTPQSATFDFRANQVPAQASSSAPEADTKNSDIKFLFSIDDRGSLTPPLHASSREQTPLLDMD